MATSQTGTQSPILLTGLSGGTYQVTVTPSNAFGTGAAASAASTVVVPAGPTIAAYDWGDEFPGNSLSTATDTGGGNWRFNGNGQNGGYTDAAANSWDVTPAQGASTGVISVQNSALRIKCMRNPGLSGVSNAWIGASLCSNFNQSPALQWIYGYFEFRARIPNPCRGMFPALWFYNNNAPSGKNNAELDLLEIFGQSSGQPYAGGIHGPEDKNINTTTADTQGYHRYAMDWQPTYITYYRDGTSVGTVTGSDATWFQGINFGIRMDYVMDPSFAANPGPTVSVNSGTLDPPAGFQPYMDVDYIRHWSTMPNNLGTGTADPMNMGG
jgi:beta-glucanase (GH16 family)